MKWSPEAEEAIKKVPFFVRKRVRARVEKEASATGRPVVSLADVKATQKRFLSNMSREVKGYRLDTCFGPSGCPNRAIDSSSLLARIETELKNADLLGFLKERVGDNLKFHHEFRLTIADCPNACSQPQIKDIGIIGACLPAITEAECTECEACVEVCKEDAVEIVSGSGPRIDMEACLSCGQCIPVCPTATLAEGRSGYRIQLGGKLGRHPQLAREVPGLFAEDQVIEMVKTCLDYYKQNSRNGERFAQFMTEAAFTELSQQLTRLD
jgi:dissimilatory sulfite reductase (desulfoviridin) alpha/beta subunit